MKFKVNVRRVGYRETEIEVEADDPKQAQAIAQDRAADIDFPPEHESEYWPGVPRPVVAES